ncbi:kinesin light chain-related protein 3 [Tanacetum coccineum]|uniref:Kinesin light chain-related protein 3 n=1 Tax=Tanacetum coccineum TaxID=301880 RepID=A0ABQ5GAV7_9ASTR
MDGTNEDKVCDEVPENGNSAKNKENAGGSGVVVEPSIEELYDNVCDMQSSNESVSRLSYGSDGEESRIDSELRHLVGGEMREVEILKETEEDSKQLAEESSNSHSPKYLKKVSRSQLGSEASSRSSPKSKTPQKNNLLSKKTDNKSRKPLIDDKESDRGPYLLKQARDLMSSNANPRKALDVALRAKSSFEKSSNGKPSLDMVMCLHVIAAIHCSLSEYNEAIQVLEESIKIPIVNESQDHGLAKFSGLMQMGDTYSMLGQLENALKCYTYGLEMQKSVLGDFDPRIGETCRYLSEAHVQALDFNEAKQFCEMAIEIHVKNGLSLEEAADRRLMGLICETKGDHEGALEHLVLASMSMVANGQENEVSYIDLSIGDTYLSLSRFDEAIFAYQKALKSLKKSKGENHPSVASVFTRLADLYNKTGNLKESKSYCENALRIYENPVSGIPPEEIASGFTNISHVYESMDEFDQALELLHKALRIYNDVPGQQSMIAAINCFEEARSVLERECGLHHPDTLAVYSNLAGTYDAVGRLDDAIEILEHIVETREEKLGTAGFDVEDEKRRLAELLKEAGKYDDDDGCAALKSSCYEVIVRCRNEKGKICKTVKSECVDVFLNVQCWKETLVPTRIHLPFQHLT